MIRTFALAAALAAPLVPSIAAATSDGSTESVFVVFDAVDTTQPWTTSWVEIDPRAQTPTSVEVVLHAVTDYQLGLENMLPDQTWQPTGNAMALNRLVVREHYWVPGFSEPLFEQTSLVGGFIHGAPIEGANGDVPAPLQPFDGVLNFAGRSGLYVEPQARTSTLLANQLSNQQAWTTTHANANGKVEVGFRSSFWAWDPNYPGLGHYGSSYGGVTRGAAEIVFHYD